MKRLVFIFFLFFCSSLIIHAQTSEIVSELTPVPANAKKFSKKLPKNKSIIIIEDDLWFQVIMHFVKLPDGKRAVAVTIETLNQELAFEPTRARINIYGRITSEDKVTDGFEELLVVNVDKLKDEADFQKIARNPVRLSKVFNLPDGTYQIGVVIKDLVSGNRGIKLVKFQISDSDTIKITAK